MSACIYVCMYVCKKVKVKQSPNRPGFAQRVPGISDSQIFMTFGTWRWWGCQPHAPAAFTPPPPECSWYSFSLGAESTPGPWYGRKEYVTGKSSDTTGNLSRDRPTSIAQRLNHYATPGPKCMYYVCMYIFMYIIYVRMCVCIMYVCTYVSYMK
jgi:hypothetical protein